MLSKKFIEIFGLAVAFVSLMILMGSFAYAKEEEHKVPHRSVEAASPSEKPTMEYPVCPHCKEVRLTSNTKRGIVAGKKMKCPHCKDEVKELAVHHCDKCGNDVMVCVLCQKASSVLKPATIEYPVCPHCKEVRLTSNTKRGIVAGKKMKCPHCKDEVEELAVHHCDKCGNDVMVCVLCQKASVDLEPATMESRCPKCKRVLARRIKGTIAPPVKWEMKCPDCGKKSEKWLNQHCDTCDIDFIVCPLCKKEQGKS